MIRVIRSLAVAAMLLSMAVALPAEAATNTTNGSLTLSISGPDQTAVGQPMTVTLAVTNASTVPLTSTQVGVGFPQASAKLVAPLANPDLCARGGSGGVSTGVSCFIGDLQPGDTTTISFGLQALTAGTLTLNASAGFFQSGIWLTESTELAIAVAPAATDVQISGSATTGSPQAGAIFYYVFQVKNGSGQPAYGVAFTDAIPQAESLLSASISSGVPCSISGGNVSCSLGDLGVGSQVTLTIGVRAPATLGSVTDSASAYATNADTNLSNNTVAVTVNVK
jgi:uncharacterized repeat protein (TIGR01451 family)